MTKYTADPERQRQRKRELQRKARQHAFENETDPLIGKLLRGEITQDEYDARCAKIRERFPYP